MSGVFLRRSGGLVEMREEPYELEDRLQTLIAEYPNLLAGDQVDQVAPRRWLLLSREVALAAQADSGGRWSVDHLLFDQDAIPTLVEVKRSSDTRLRREVVGQMLDYAANAVVYWKLDAIRTLFEARCQGEGLDPEHEVASVVGSPETDYDEFWERGSANLAAGRIRLVFVADEIPAELQRIVEFLNERMAPTEVLAIEIKQFVGGGEQALVPRVIGRTAEATQRKRRSKGREWDEATFLQAVENRLGAADAEVARKIIDWSRTALPRFNWGSGQQSGSFAPALDIGDHSYWPFYLWTNGRVELQFKWMGGMPPFDEEEKQRVFLSKINEIPGVAIPEDVLSRRQPHIRLELLQPAESLTKFFAAIDWFLEQGRTPSV